MWTTVLYGGLAGGAVAWVWGAISWGVLPWHHATFQAFSGEDDIARAILRACPRPGVYGLPAPPRHSPGADKATRDAADQAAQARMRGGPIITAIIQPTGFGSVPLAMLRAFVIYTAFAAVVTGLLLQTAGLSQSEVAFAAAVGLAAGLLCRFTDWNWHGYSTSYALVCVADHVIGSALVGLVIAKVV